MYIDHISLLDYRTYAMLSLPLSAGVTVFLGSNGVGKTNIVEAIDYAASRAAGSGGCFARLYSDPYGARFAADGDRV